MEGNLKEEHSISLVDLYFQRSDEYESFDWKLLKKNDQINPKEILCDGLLCESISNKHKMDLHYYLLTIKGIYKFNDNKPNDQQAFLSFCLPRISLIIEKNMQKFGFAICFLSHTYTFFSDNEFLILKWYDSLRTIGIMTEIESHYQLKKCIVKKENYEIYGAISNTTNVKFIFKTYFKEKIIKSSTKIKQIINEILNLRALRHKNISQLIDVCEEQEYIHLIFEHYKNIDLLTTIQNNGCLNEDDASKLISTLLSALKYIHSVGIIHRNLKLENIMVMNLFDYSSIKLIAFNYSSKINPSSKIRCGTPGYVAPEILKKEYYNEKIDIFSVGVIAYIIQIGKLIPKPTLIDPSTGNEVDNPEFINKIDFENLSIAGREAILQMLNIDPSKRCSANDALNLNWFKVKNPKILNQLNSPEENIRRSTINNNFSMKIENLRRSSFINRSKRNSVYEGSLKSQREGLENYFQKKTPSIRTVSNLKGREIMLKSSDTSYFENQFLKNVMLATNLAQNFMYNEDVKEDNVNMNTNGLQINGISPDNDDEEFCEGYRRDIPNFECETASKSKLEALKIIKKRSAEIFLKNKKIII